MRLGALVPRSVFAVLTRAVLTRAGTPRYYVHSTRLSTDYLGAAYLVQIARAQRGAL